MSFDRCTPKSVTGDIVGSQALNNGGDVDEAVLARLGDEGIASFFSKYSEGTAGIIDDVPDSIYKPFLKNEQSYWRQFTDQFKDSRTSADGGATQRHAIEGLQHQVATPSSILGSDIVDEFDDLLQDLSQRGISSGKDYTTQVKRFMDGVDTDGFTDGQRIYWEAYKNTYLDGSRIKKGSGWLEQKLDAVTKGVVIANPTVIGGNMVEPFVKGIPLYGKNFFKGISRLVEEHGTAGLFKELPDLGKQGLYGLDVGETSTAGVLEKAMSVLDRPAKNMMYYVGMVDGGTEAAGRAAIQKTLFLPTMANTPLIYRDPLSRSSVRLLSYSIGTTQLFTDVIRDAIQRPSADSISKAAGLFAGYGALTGIPAYMGMQGEEVGDIPVIGPVWKAAADVSSINIPNRIGIPAAIFNRMLKPLSKVATKLFAMEGDELEPKDIYGAASALAFISSGNNSGIEKLTSNTNIARGVKNSIEAITGEKEAGEAFMSTFVPGYRD